MVNENYFGVKMVDGMSYLLFSKKGFLVRALRHYMISLSCHCCFDWCWTGCAGAWSLWSDWRRAAEAHSSLSCHTCTALPWTRSSSRSCVKVNIWVTAPLRDLRELTYLNPVSGSMMAMTYACRFLTLPNPPSVKKTPCASVGSASMHSSSHSILSSIERTLSILPSSSE